MKNEDYSKNLLKIQKEYMKCQEEITGVLIQMKETLVAINDQNVLHASKEDSRYDTIEKLISADEARAKVTNATFLLLASAIVVLAGAEKALQFLKI
jgi:hypothetical protein